MSNKYESQQCQEFTSETEVAASSFFAFLPINKLRSELWFARDTKMSERVKETGCFCERKNVLSR